MAVNRFSTPVQSTYMSQYVPIPFEQLYALGKEYNTRVDKAYSTLNEQVSKWTDFQSPSAVDTARWNELTLEPAKELVDRLAANPDLIKTAAGRAEIQSFINSRPYGELNALKQSRDNMLKRQKLEQQLSLTGKYNPLWHEVDYTNYDTKSGVFNDLSLIPYMSEVEMVKPYLDNLEDSYLYSSGMYDYTGVSGETTDKILKANESAIYNTPQAQMHIKALMRQGSSEEDARNKFTNSIYRAGREFARVKREVNPYALMQYKSALERAKKEQENGVKVGQEDILSKDFDDKRQTIISSMMVDSNGNPSALSQKYTDLFRKNAEEINSVVALIEQSSPEFSKVLNDGISLLAQKGITGNQAVALSLKNALSSTKDKINPQLLDRLNKLNSYSNQISSDMTDEAYGEYYSRTFNQILGKPVNENPFSSLKREAGRGKFFSDTKGQHMWSMALVDTMQEISSATESEINKELFKSETPKNEKGFLISPSMLLSPKNFIFNSNKYLQKLAKDVDFDVQGTVLDRNSMMMHEGDSNLSLEERVASGEFGRVRVQRVVGYVDTPENRNYVVEVSLPMDEDDSALGKKMTAWWRWDEIESSIADAGYQVVPREDGGKDLVLTMVIPESNKNVDKRRRNARYQKEYGTTGTKEIQSALDDAALMNIQNYSTQYGYKEK